MKISATISRGSLHNVTMYFVVREDSIPGAAVDGAGLPGLAAIVPVYNEVDTVAESTRRVAEIALIEQVVVVDDGSTDGSVEVVRRLARELGVVAAYHQENRGKGAAVRTGLEMVDRRFVIIHDADLEYDPQDIPRLAAGLTNGSQVVYGSRIPGHKRHGMQTANYVANRVLTAIFNRLYGRNLSDVETGYKLCATGLLRFLDITSDGFEMDPELSAKIARFGEEIVEVPVTYRGRSVREGKKIRAADAMRAAATLWRYRHWEPPQRVELKRPRFALGADGDGQ